MAWQDSAWQRLHGVDPGPGAAKIVIKSDDAMHLGTRQVQLLCDERNGARGNEPQRRLHGMQHFQQRAWTPQVFGDNAPHDGAVARR